MNNSSTGAGGGRRRSILIIVGLVFLGPLAIASFYYYGAGGWHPSGSVANGHLFDPVRPLPASNLRLVNGDSTETMTLVGFWTLVYLSPGPCDTDCRKSLYDTRQVRASLGQKDTRVQRLLITNDPQPDLGFFAEYHTDLKIAAASDAGSELIRAFGSDFDHPDDDFVLTLNRVYLVDPLGNLVLAYESGFEAKGLLEDLKRLLRLSRIG